MQLANLRCGSRDLAFTSISLLCTAFVLSVQAMEMASICAMLSKQLRVGGQESASPNLCQCRSGSHEKHKKHESADKESFEAISFPRTRTHLAAGWH